MLAGLSPARRRVVLTLLALVAVAAVVLVVAVASRSSAPEAGPVSQERPGPVLLVPGYGGATGSVQGLSLIHI